MSEVTVPDACIAPCMDSFLGAWAGVLRGMGDERSMDDLWGLSSWAFRTQVHKTLVMEGLLPRKWDEVLSGVALRSGYACEAGLRDFFYTPDDLRQIQMAWMRTSEKALKDGRPAVSFGIHGPVFGTIWGFDDETENYSVSSVFTPETGGKLNALELGSLHPPLIFVLIPTGPLADYDIHVASKQAVTVAIDHHLGVEKDAAGNRLDYGEIIAGPAGYNAWSTAIETRTVAQHWTLAYHAGYYAEARSAGAAWLRKSADVLGSESSKLLVQAARNLSNEVECLTHLAKLFPMADPHSMDDSGKRIEASASLRMARAEHIAALEALMAAMERSGEPSRLPVV